MAATLHLERQAWIIQGRDFRIGSGMKFHIILDGLDICVLKYLEKMQMTIVPGQHKMAIRVEGSGASVKDTVAELDFQVEDGQTLTLFCGIKQNGVVYLSTQDIALIHLADPSAQDLNAGKTMRNFGSLLRLLGGFSLAMTAIELWKVGFPRLEGPEGKTWGGVLIILSSYVIMALISAGVLALGSYLVERNTKKTFPPPVKPDGKPGDGTIQG